VTPVKVGKSYPDRFLEMKENFYQDCEQHFD